MKHYLLRRVLGQGRRRRVLRRQLEVDSHLVCSQLLLVDKDHVALLAGLETLVDGLDVVEEGAVLADAHEDFAAVWAATHAAVAGGLLVVGDFVAVEVLGMLLLQVVVMRAAGCLVGRALEWIVLRDVTGVTLMLRAGLDMGASYRLGMDTLTIDLHLEVQLVS